jgi:hypothetical protein
MKRTAYRMSVVLTLVPGCTEGSSSPEHGGPTSASRSRQPAPSGVLRPPSYVVKSGGACLLVEPDEPCHDGMECNPPAPVAIECPPEVRSSSTAFDDWRPPGKEGWYRVRPSMWTTQRGCEYVEDSYCHPSRGRAGCDERQVHRAACAPYGSIRDKSSVPRPPKALVQPIWVAPLVAGRGGGRCEALPGFWCEAQTICELPSSGNFVPCVDGSSGRPPR